MGPVSAGFEPPPNPPCACAGDTKATPSSVAPLYVVFLASQLPYPNLTITDPALRLANATELAVEDDIVFSPAVGYVYK